MNSKEVARNQLLLRLQSSSWAYCGRCLKLHPRKEFSEISLAQPALRRYCTGYAGIIDLCPCAALTIRELGHLAKLLESPTTPCQTKIGPFTFDRDGGPQPSAYVSAGLHLTGPHLNHQCSLATTSDYKARVEIRISIDSSGSPGIFARYTISFSSSYAHWKAHPIFHCPHWDLTSLMSRKDAVQVCPGCRAISMRRRAPEPEGTDTVVFEVTRILGSGKWPPDFRWLDNCHLTGPAFSQNAIYW